MNFRPSDIVLTGVGKHKVGRAETLKDLGKDVAVAGIARIVDGANAVCKKEPALQ